MDIPSKQSDSGSIFGMLWSDFMKVKGIREEDLWPNSMHVPYKSLLSARLFPLVENTTGWRDLLWLQTDVNDLNISPSSRLESWRSSKR